MKKVKTFTPTKAKLPENEMILGGDASPKLFRKSNLKQIEAEYQKHLKKHGKKPKKALSLLEKAKRLPKRDYGSKLTTLLEPHEFLKKTDLQ